MSRRIVFGLIAALVSTGAVVAASQPSPAVRAVAEAAINKAMGPAEADEPAGMRAPKAAMFRRIDVNGDGVADWRIDYEKGPNPSYFCGTGGCRQQILVSNAKGGYDIVFDRLVRQFKLHRANGQTVLDVDFHGSTCGGYGVDDCPRSYGWITADQRFVERPSAGQTFLFGGPAPAARPAEAAVPAAVRASIQARQDVCRKRGGAYPFEDASVTDVADLNGDGVRDWIVGGPYDSCAFDEEIPEGVPSFPVSVFISTGAGFSRAFEDHPMAWGLDLNGASATFVTLSGSDGCGLNGEGCEKLAWRWDGAALVSKAAEQP